MPLQSSPAKTAPHTETAGSQSENVTSGALEALIHQYSAELVVVRTEIQALSNRSQEKGQQDASLIDAFSRRLFLLDYRNSMLQEIEDARAEFTSGDAEDILARLNRSPTPKAASQLDLLDLREKLKAWNLFSPDWYRRTYHDSAALDDESALQHFLRCGVDTCRDPHPLFSSAWIVRNSNRLIETSPIVAYLTGQIVDSPHPLFDPQFYLASNSDVRNSGMSAFEHYVRFGALERRQPHPAFDPQWYGNQRGSSVEDGVDLLVHYLSEPSAFGTSPHPLFDATWYLQQLPWLSNAGVNPLLHYLVRGEREGRPPHPLFEPAYYLKRNPDVAAAGISAFVHFLRFGASELRVGHPLFDPAFYSRVNNDFPAARQNPLQHYVLEGAKLGLVPSDNYPTKAMAEAFPDLEPTTQNPLVALINGRGLKLDVTMDNNRAIASTGQPQPIRQDTNRLRDYAKLRCGAEVAARLHQMMNIIQNFKDQPQSFVHSTECESLRQSIVRTAHTSASDVKVSIIIPVHNALLYTITCVAFLLEFPPKIAFEILIGDDASTDATPQVFTFGDKLVRLIRHERNLGFLENCNSTASCARGQYLVFLNNDTLPLPGWLDALVSVTQRSDRIGVVGSKLLNGDGTLQEAGSILWRDGSAWNFGRGGDPNASSFNYLKDVDYCSAASILVRREAWDELKGFDPEFKPAYYEDTDFCFRARAAGYRTIYQPLSEVVHHEGRSHGTDEKRGLKAHQAVNRDKFFGRWRDTLASENWPNGENVELARDRSRQKPHLLVVDHYVPQWDRDAGSRAIYQFVRAFVDKGFQVIFWPDNLYQDPVYTAPLQQIGVEVIYGSEFVGQFARWFAENAPIIPYVVLSRPHISISYINAVRAQPDKKILYYGHDVHWKRLLDQHAISGSEDALSSSKYFRQLETQVSALSDVVMYPSEEEREIVSKLFDHKKTVLAIPLLLHDEKALAIAAKNADMGRRNPHQLLFVGGFGHPPNVDAVLWFEKEVFPHLRKTGRAYRLTIVGSNPSDEVRALAGDDIEITGQVSDERLAALYETAGMAVVPLRFGGGVKGKIIEAFSKAVPVVTTPVGVQGIPDAEGFVFMAASAQQFAEEIIRATDHPDIAIEKAQRALEFLRHEYTATKLFALLAPTIPELAR